MSTLQTRAPLYSRRTSTSGLRLPLFLVFIDLLNYEVGSPRHTKRNWATSPSIQSGSFNLALDQTATPLFDPKVIYIVSNIRPLLSKKIHRLGQRGPE